MFIALTPAEIRVKRNETQINIAYSTVEQASPTLLFTVTPHIVDQVLLALAALLMSTEVRGSSSGLNGVPRRACCKLWIHTRDDCECINKFCWLWTHTVQVQWLSRCNIFRLCRASVLEALTLDSHSPKSITVSMRSISAHPLPSIGCNLQMRQVLRNTVCKSYVHIKLQGLRAFTGSEMTPWRVLIPYDDSRTYFQDLHQ